MFNRIILKSANLTGGKGRDFLSGVNIPYPKDESMCELYRKLASLPPEEQQPVNDQIDKAVYHLFGLNDEEMAYIDSL